MKLPYFFPLLTFLLHFSISEPARAHIFDPSVLENITVWGDVPKSGYIDLRGKREASVHDALVAAGFDPEALKSSKVPYPFRIEIGYVANREPSTVLDLQGDLLKTLEIKVNLGGNIQVTDFAKLSAQFAANKKLLNSGWQTSPDLAFSRLKETVRLNHELIHWKNPKSQKSFEDVKQIVLNKLTEETHTVLRKYILKQLELRRLEVEQYHKSDTFLRALESLNNQLHSWIAEQ